MVYLIVNWVLSVICLLAVAGLLPGVRVLDFQSALTAAGVVGLLSALLGVMLRHAAGPLSLGVSGFFLAVVDAFLFRVSALVIPGFTMRGFAPAIIGALTLLALNLALLRWPLKDNPLDSESALQS